MLSCLGKVMIAPMVSTKSGLINAHQILFWFLIAQYPVLNTGSMVALGHPDALFQHDAMQAADTVSKDRKPFFQAKSFQVDKADRIQRAVSILVCAQGIDRKSTR